MSSKKNIGDTPKPLGDKGYSDLCRQYLNIIITLYYLYIVKICARERKVFLIEALTGILTTHFGLIRWESKSFPVSSKIFTDDTPF